MQKSKVFFPIRQLGPESFCQQRKDAEIEGRHGIRRYLRPRLYPIPD